MPGTHNNTKAIHTMSATAKSNPPTKMNRITIPPAPVPGREDIALCALGIWKAEGCPEGRDREHWLRAETLLTEHLNVGAGSVMDERPRRSKQNSPKQRQQESVLRR